MAKFNKERKCIEFGPDDTLSDITNILEQQIRSILDKFNEACYHAFAQYGYDKDWIHDPENRKRIDGRYVSSDVSFGIPMDVVFSVDGKSLFQVIGKSYTSNNIGIWEFRIKYLAPLGDHV